MSQHNESKQHSQNYIARVCEQVRWKKAHDVVSEELLAHIEDQAEVYREEGYTEEEAEYLAVEQMGDPILTGGQFDKVYRPRVEWNILLLAGCIILLGTMFRIAMQMATGTSVYWGKEIINILMGIPLLAFGYCMDYTVLFGKYFAMIAGIVAILTAWLAHKIVFITGGNLVYYLIPLWLLLFTRSVYAVRQKGATGFMLLFLEIMLMLLIFVFCFDVNASGIFLWLSSCFIIMLYILRINWLGCSKKCGFIFLVYPLIFAALIISHPYRINRFMAMLNPFVDQLGAGYIPSRIFIILQNAKLFGSGDININFVAQYLPEMHTDYILTSAVSHWGWASLLFVLIGFGMLFAFCIAATRKVKSQMGKLVVITITVCWMIQLFLYLMTNFTTLQISTYPLLFVQGAWMRMINLFLLGIVLSVYKTGSVQKDTEPKVKVSKDVFAE